MDIYTLLSNMRLMTLMTPAKPAISYRRASTDRQNSNGIGLDLQKVAIDKFAEAAGYHVLEDYAEGGSGGAASTRRPALRSALDHARLEKCSLIVDDLSRLSRDTSTMEEMVRQYGVQIVSARLGDVEDAVAIGKIARAQKERELISERTRQALQQRKTQGVVLGNPTNLDEAQKLGAEGNVFAKRQKVKEIQRVLEEEGLDASATAGEVAEALNRHGVVTRQGLMWSKTNVRPALKLARELAEQERNLALRSNPNFGRFG